MRSYSLCYKQFLLYTKQIYRSMNRKDLIANVIICPKQEKIDLPITSTTYSSETRGTATASNPAWKTLSTLNTQLSSIPGNDQPRGGIRSSPRLWTTGQSMCWKAPSWDSRS